MTGHDSARTKLRRQRWVASCSQYQQYREIADKVEKDPLVSKWYQQGSDSNHDSSQGSDPGEHFKCYQEVFAGLFTIKFILTEQTPLPVLDMCIAPGSFARAIISKNEETFVTGTTLSPSEGDHLMHVQGTGSLQRFQARFLCEHRDVVRSPKSPFPSRGSQQNTNTKFDFVVADGAPFNQEVGPCKRHLSDFLICSELITALTPIRHDGTLIMLLHRLDDWKTAHIVRSLQACSKLRLHKPKETYTHRSSFYIIADDIQPSHPEATRPAHMQRKRVERENHPRVADDDAGFVWSADKEAAFV